MPVEAEPLGEGGEAVDGDVDGEVVRLVQRAGGDQGDQPTSPSTSIAP
jgi:hypothetical protein